MFEIMMLLCFAYAGFCYLLPDAEEKGTGTREEKRDGEVGRAEGAGRRLGPRGRGCRRRNEAGPKRPLLSKAG